MKNPFFEVKKKEPEKAKKLDLGSIGIPNMDKPIVRSEDYNENGNDSSQIEEQIRDKLKGDDYYSKFIATKEVLSAIPSEDMKYASAFAALSISGLTKEKLVIAAQAALDKIKNEMTEFEAGYKVAYDEQVVTNNRILTVKSAELAELVGKINKINSDIEELKKSTESADRRLRDRSITFKSAAMHVGASIENEITKINKYIK